MISGTQEARWRLSSPAGLGIIAVLSIWIWASNYPVRPFPDQFAVQLIAAIKVTGLLLLLSVALNLFTGDLIRWKSMFKRLVAICATITALSLAITYLPRLVLGN